MTGWQVVIPYRGLGRSKSRLALPAATPADLRPRLAAAFLFDVVAACLATAQVEHVTVVSSDAQLREQLTDSPVEVVPDPRAGLNPAVRTGVEAARRRLDGPVAVLTGDLPGLTACDLAAALDRAGGLDETGRWLVPDRAGTGTTCLLLPPGAPLAFAFGLGSARRHRDLGYADLGLGPESTLRFDVDTLDDLLAAIAVGVGLHTAALSRLLEVGPQQLTG